jgi:hypothetical protein
MGLTISCSLLKFGALTMEDYGVIHNRGDGKIPGCAHPLGFAVFAGDGCSTRTFGLAIHAANPGQWQWEDSCKSQYASNPDYGGLAHFLCCDLTGLKLLGTTITTQAPVLDRPDFEHLEAMGRTPSSVEEAGDQA